MSGRHRMGPRDAEYGRGQHEIEIDSADDGFDLVERLRETFRSPSYTPPMLSGVALELLAISRNVDVDYRTVLHLLEQDALIAGKVLRLAQSSIYQRGGPVKTLEHAVVQLGLRTLADLCLHAAMTARVFRAPGYEGAMNELRRHSAATAHVMRLLSAEVSFPQDYSYTCGLMHDVGIAAGLAVLGDVPRGNERPPLPEVIPALGAVHEELAGVLAAAWRLPEDVRFVLAHHHHPMHDGRMHPLIAALGLAEAIASDLGVPSVADEETDTEELAARLKLAPESLARIMKAAEKTIQALD